MSCRDLEPMLNPYLDGELSVSDVLAVERHFADCAVCQAQYRELEKLRADIADARLGYAAPRGLRVRIERARPAALKAKAAWWWGGAGLAAAAALVFALAVPQLGMRSGEGKEVLDGHLRSLLASQLVDVPSSDRHTVKPWFQGKVGFSPNVPDLSKEGFVLVGGRLDVIRQQRAVALVYKRREHVINLFATEGSRTEPERESESNGYHLIAWGDRGLGYWAVSDLNATELGEFVQLVKSAEGPSR